MSDYGCPTKIKDGMPKKHDPKKKERGVTMSEKIERKKGMIQEREPML